MSKEIISTDSAPAPQGAYSQAVKAGGFVFVSGQIPIDMSTGIISAEGVHKETRIVIDNIANILNAAGSSLSNVVKFTIFLTKIDDIRFVDEVLLEKMGADLPARAVVEVSKLPKNISIEIDAIAEA